MSLFGFSSFADMFDGGGRGGSGSEHSTLSHSDYLVDYQSRHGHADASAQPFDTTLAPSTSSHSDPLWGTGYFPSSPPPPLDVGVKFPTGIKSDDLPGGMKSSVRMELSLGAEEGTIASVVTTFSKGPLEFIGFGADYNLDDNTISPSGKVGNIKSDYFLGHFGVGGSYDPFTGDVSGRLSFGNSKVNAYVETDIQDMGRFLVEVEVMRVHQQNIAVMSVINGVRSAVGLPDLDHPSLEYAKPLILDLDGDGIETNFGQNSFFDFDDDGYFEQGSWVSASDGFLAIDLDKDGTRVADGGVADGQIDQTRELQNEFFDARPVTRKMCNGFGASCGNTAPNRGMCCLSGRVTPHVAELCGMRG